MSEPADAIEIEPERLGALRRVGAALQIVDVRDDWEREVCALSGALAMPMATLPQHVDEGYEIEAVMKGSIVVGVCH